MKKISLLLLVAVLTIFTAACGNTETKKSASSDQIKVYTTVYPLQYFAERIGGDHVSVSSIYPPGSNEHTFEPTQKDMIDLADADLFFYIGLGLEGFVNNAQKTLKNENVEMIETTKDVPESALDVSTASKEHDHDHDAHEDEAHEDEHDHGTVDPHVWLSPVISQDLAKSVKDSLVKKDAKHKEDYEKNYEALIKDLKDLNTDYKEMADNAKRKEFFVSHAAFGYIAGTYGLKQEAIAGLNSQDEPSQKELTTIASEAKKDNIQYILFEQNVSSKLADVLKNDIGAESLTINNLSVLTKEDLAAKKDYVSIMKENLETFKKVLQ